MGFFDHFTVNGFVTHLELASRSDVPSLTWREVSKAFDGMRKIEQKGLQEMLSYEGWKYVVHLSTQIGMVAAIEKADTALRDIRCITDQAIKWRDEAYQRELREADEGDV
jgi:hypothetical protein